MLHFCFNFFLQWPRPKSSPGFEKISIFSDEGIQIFVH